MKVALIGYGKMGKAIEEILLQRGHEATLKINRTPNSEELENIDVAIEFSKPEVALNNLKSLLENSIPTVCGTTGWLDHLVEIEKIVDEKNGSFLTTTNFSLGVNIFFDLNEKLAAVMQKYPEYQVAVEEIHHTQKLDAPSGTAITLAQGIIKNSEFNAWNLVEDLAQKTNDLPIVAKRIENVPGTHQIDYISDIDTISITHVAHNRKGFALGAVIAAEFISDKKGIFNMKDVLGL